MYKVMCYIKKFLNKIYRIAKPCIGDVVYEDLLCAILRDGMCDSRGMYKMEVRCEGKEIRIGT